VSKFYKLDVLDIGREQLDNAHGFALHKDLIVLHETVSPDYAGWADVRQVSQYLDNKDYGIHAVVDLEGHIAWAKGLGRAIFYHTASHGTRGNGYVNTRGIGIELVSRVMLTARDNTARWRIWWARNKQIDAVAKLVATVARAHGIPLIESDGSTPGVTTHWEVTKRFGVYGGHVDCWPRHLGGYFPKRRVLARARVYQKLGY
jgi:hypothetical protein